MIRFQPVAGAFIGFIMVEVTHIAGVHIFIDPEGVFLIGLQVYLKGGGLQIA
jgi:hypothetical protein